MGKRDKKDKGVRFLFDFLEIFCLYLQYRLISMRLENLTTGMGFVFHVLATRPSDSVIS